MNTFKKKSLYTAVLAGLGALGAAGTTEAVHVNPDGTGQVLLYPYYTVRNAPGGTAYNSLLSVVNTQNNAKIVKVRFIEGKASREVLDFNLFLSPNDVWTGAILPTADGARIATNDNSCVAPNDLFTRAPGVLEAFKNFDYTTAPYSLAGVSLDRTREGYVEIIEMAVVTRASVVGYITHNSAGIPGNCAALDPLDAFTGNTNPDQFPNTIGGAVVANSITNPPSGGLAGRMSIINPASGTNFSYDATALGQWTSTNQYQNSGNSAPNLGSLTAVDRFSNVFVNGGVVSSTWNNSRDAVSAALMRDAVINEFILDTATASSTDWVVTFPTKNLYVLTNTITAAQASGAVAGAPFANGFTAVGSCDPYGVAIFDREERGPTNPAPTILPSPAPPSGVVPGSTLCWEANVLPFQASSLLGSTNTNALVSTFQAFATAANTTAGTRTSVASGTVQGANGWLYMSFADRTRQYLYPLTATLNGAALPVALFTTIVAPSPNAGLISGTHYGLPVIGFAVHNYTRTGVVSNYGGVLNHKFSRLIPTS